MSDPFALEDEWIADHSDRTYLEFVADRKASEEAAEALREWRASVIPGRTPLQAEREWNYKPGAIIPLRSPEQYVAWTTGTVYRTFSEPI